MTILYRALWCYCVVRGQFGSNIGSSLAKAYSYLICANPSCAPKLRASADFLFWQFFWLYWLYSAWSVTMMNDAFWQSHCRGHWGRCWRLERSSFVFNPDWIFWSGTYRPAEKEARSNPTPPPSFHIRGRWHTGCPHSNNLNHLCTPMHEPIFAGSMMCGLVALLSVLILYI
jgi:hypothetical protein